MMTNEMFSKKFLSKIATNKLIFNSSGNCEPNICHPYLFDVEYKCDEGWNEKNQAVGQVTHLSVKPNYCEVQKTFSANI